MQVHLDSEETLESKIAFEKEEKANNNTIKHYHADNGRFAENTFRDHIKNGNQTISFCGVG